MEVGTQELRCQGIPESYCGLLCRDTLLKISFLPSSPQGSMRLSELRWGSDRTALENSVRHGTRAEVCRGLCVLCRQRCLEADSWRPWDPSCVLRVLEGCVSKQKTNHHLPCAHGQDRESRSHHIERVLCSYLFLWTWHLLRNLELRV